MKCINFLQYKIWFSICVDNLAYSLLLIYIPELIFRIAYQYKKLKTLIKKILNKLIIRAGFPQPILHTSPK